MPQYPDNNALIKALKDGEFVDTIGENGETPFCRSCLGGDLSTMKILVDAGADINRP